MTDQDRPEIRISDADRDRGVQFLNQALAEGRLTMPEFDERVGAVMQARTASELAPHLTDLPGAEPYLAGLPGAVATAPERGELRTTMSTVNRRGRWVVPRRLMVHSKAGTVNLDLTEAVISHPVIEVVLEVYAGTVRLILPPGASVNVEGVEVGMVASSVKVKKVLTATEPAGQPHLVISGKQWAGTLVVRYQRRFLGWRW